MAAHLLLRSANGAAREIAALPGLRLVLQPGETLVFPMGTPGIQAAGDDLQLSLPPDGARLVLEGFLAALRKGEAVAIETAEQRLDTLAEVVASTQPAAGDPPPAPAELPGSGAGLVTAPAFESARLDQPASPAPVALGEIVRTVFTAVVPEVLRPLETSAAAVGALVSGLPIPGGGAPPTQPILPVVPPPEIPDLIVAPAAGAEDGTIALTISAGPNQAGDVVTVTIAGVPAGASLSAGSDLGGGVWSLSLADLAGLTMRPPLNQDTGFALTVTATAEQGGQTASSTPAALNVAITPVVDRLFTAGDDTVDLTGADVTVPDFVNPWAQDGNRSNAQAGNDIVLLASGGPNALAAGTTFLGGSGNDTITGGALNDIVDGGSENDAIAGGGGADTLVGGAGADTLSGGEGDDLLLVASLADYAAGETIDGGDGSDTLRFTSGANSQLLVLTGATMGIEVAAIANAAGATTGTNSASIDASAVANALTLIGNNGANTLVGTTGADVIQANGGNDIVVIQNTAAHAPGELIDGGTGTDTIRFAGTTPGEMLVLQAGVTSVEAAAIASAAGVATGTTPLGIDASAVATGMTLSGNDGTNTLIGTAQNDTLLGNGGNDTLVGGLGADRMDGGAGDDAIVLRSLAEYVAGESLIGGAGADVVRFDSANAGDTLTVTASTSGVETFAIADAVGSTAGTTALNLSVAAVTTGVTLIGNEGANTLTGTAQADTILGNGGADTLIGGDGADLVDGGAGDDVLIVATSGHFDAGESLIGGDGIDTLRFASTTANQGLTFVAGALPNGIEIFAIADAQGSTAGTTALSLNVAVSATAVTLIGNDGNNTLTATAGADTILANAGNDTVFAGEGADSVDLGLGTDVLVIAAAAEHGLGEALDGGAGTDTIRFASTTAGETLALLAATIGFEAVAIASAAGATTGTAALNLDASLVGNGLALTGNNGDNTITGTAFADTIVANTGNDVIVIADAAHYAAGETLNGGTGTDALRFTTTTDGQALVLAGGTATSGVEIAALSDAQGGTSGTTQLNLDASALTGTMTLVGNDGANTLVGTSGTTTILGNGGDDTLVGGDGADSLDGGTGDDVFLLATTGHYDAGEAMQGGDGFDTLRFTSTTAGQTLTLLATTSGLERVAIADDQGNTTGTTALNVIATNVATGLEILGNDGANTLTGTGIADLIQGNGGADTITGRGGADTLAGGAGSDDFIYNLLSEGGDRILDFDFATSTTRVDRLAFQDDAFGGAGINIGNANESFTFRSGNNAALNLAGTEFGVKTDAVVAHDQATVQSLIDSFTNVTTGALFLFSDGTDAHVWFDPNPSVVGGAVEVATLVGQNLASLTNVDASDIRVI